jgi:hypothetical protein
VLCLCHCTLSVCGQRRSFDPGGDDAFKTSGSLPSHSQCHQGMGREELGVWSIPRGHPSTIPSAQGSTPRLIPLLNGRTDAPLLNACSTAAEQQREDGQKNQYPA